MEGSASDNNYDENNIDEWPPCPVYNNNYYKFLNSIIHKNEFLNNEYDSATEQEENEQYIYFNQPSKYEYDNNIPELIIIDKVLKKDKPKSNFYKYFFGSILFVSSAITVSYFFSKKRNKNKN